MRKADFNAEEWSTIVQGPAVAGLRVMAAERGGTIRESLEMAKTYVETRQAHPASELLDEIVSSRPDVDPRALGAESPDQLSANTMRILRDAVAIVDSRAPEDAPAYRDFVREVAERVACAHKEGGFLGIGGQPMSDAEQAALGEIDGIIGR